MIRILIDECLPVKLKHQFLEADPNFEVATVLEQKWTGIKNGELLKLADQHFDIFLTIDQNLPFQQEIKNFSICVVVLQSRSSRYKDLLPFIKPTVDIISKAKKGKLYQVKLD